MVLATEMTAPTTTPCSMDQPTSQPTPAPSSIDSAMPRGPPTIATHFTRSRSRSENSMPIENMSRMTPISARTSKVCTSETVGPGVNGPITIPPTT